MIGKEEQPIGVFDSGVGGLTVVKALRKILPDENIIYVGDTARVPYGNKSPETVIRYSCEITSFLMTYGIKVLLVACNTASALALPSLRRDFCLPIFGVIEPGAREAAKKTLHGRVGIIGTRATIASGAYERSLKTFSPHIKTFSAPCPLFVPLAEEGWVEEAETYAIAKHYLAFLGQENIDCLILGCTHYPLLLNPIKSAINADVCIISSADTAAFSLKCYLEEHELISKKEKGELKIFATDTNDRLPSVVGKFLGENIPKILPISLEEIAIAK